MSSPFRVAIVGGGVAGVTAMLTLADLDDGRLAVELVAPGPDFVLSAQLVGAPWGGAPIRASIAWIAGDHGAVHRQAAVAHVDAAGLVLTDVDGDARTYDAILVAPGGRPCAPYEGITTVGVDRLPAVLTQADRGSVAIVVPPGVGWKLPAYQLGLLAAASGTAPVRVLTPEERPLQLFGPAAVGPVSDFLAWHHVDVERRTVVDLATDPAALLALADHVVALPLVRGPGIGGLPSDADGFLHVDAIGRVRGLNGVFAAGDAVAGPIKQGGLAAHQAERAAHEIARLAGLPVRPQSESATVRGKLVCGEDRLYLRRDLDDVNRDYAGDGSYWRANADPGTARDTPLWQPDAAVLAWRLSRWLQAHRRGLGGDPLGPVARPQTAPRRHVVDYGPGTGVRPDGGAAGRA
jgi:sulfide:quinone oxidoreductase